MVPTLWLNALDEAFVFDKMERFNEAEWMYGLALARDPNSETVLHLYQNHLDQWRSGGNKKADSNEAH